MYQKGEAHAARRCGSGSSAAAGSEGVRVGTSRSESETSSTDVRPSKPTLGRLRERLSRSDEKAALQMGNTCGLTVFPARSIEYEQRIVQDTYPGGSRCFSIRTF
jgi:hypothetical protein